MNDQFVGYNRETQRGEIAWATFHVKVFGGFSVLPLDLLSSCKVDRTSDLCEHFKVTGQ